MKKIILSSLVLAMSLTTFAQLPYDQTLTKTMFNDDPTVVYDKSDQCTWSAGAVALGKLYNVISKVENHCVLALPSVGLPDSIFFTCTPVTSGGTLTVYESSDHVNWHGVWTQEIKTKINDATWDAAAPLSSSSRYIKFYFNGKEIVYFSEIKVTEKKALSVDTKNIIFDDAMVDAAAGTATVQVKWTNIVASVTCSDTVFSVSRTTIGEKNLENQETTLTIKYSHYTSGTHTGTIVIEGEGRRAVITVKGTTKRWSQQLIWNQTIAPEYTTISSVLLNARTNQNQQVTYVSSDPSIAYVGEDNYINILCSGEVDIMAFHPGNRVYLPTDTITKHFKFVKYSPQLTIKAGDITYGQSLRDVELTIVEGDVEGVLTFKNIDLDSVFHAGTYDLKVEFTPYDTCIYETIERYVSFVVNKANQTIEWNQGQTQLFVDETIELSARASSGLDLTYAFTACNIEIDDNMMTGVEEGDVLVIAFQEGNDDYYPSTVSMRDFEVMAKEVPTAERRVEAAPSIDELNANGFKYYHNGEVYIAYRGQVYTADGKVVK